MKEYTDPETGLRAWLPRDPGQRPWIIRVIQWLIDRLHEVKHEIESFSR